jgi:pimeloyl-ACP methyl ester carboxylesterase
MKSRILSLIVIALFSNNLFAQSPAKYDTVSVGNIKQIVSYSGSDDLPLILFVHGGPGSSRMKQAEIFSNILQKHFLVVQWDQRETGKTLALNKSSVPITLELMKSDTYELVSLLLKKFKKKKLYLAGESWGTVLGFGMAAKHPELLNAYIAFSPVVNQTKSEQLLLEKLKLEAKAKGIVQAQNELNTVKVPFENDEQLRYSRKWMLSHDGYTIADKDTTAFKKYIEDWSKTWLPTWNQAIGQNLFIDLPEINCPVYFFLGGKDLQTNSSIARDYFKILKAPKKEIFLYENAGHSVLTEEAEHVQKTIVEQILK